MKTKFDQLIINGDKKFINQTSEALDLLKLKCPGTYQSLVLKYLGAIKQSNKSGMKILAKPPTFNVGQKTTYYSLKWYACAIVHDAYHSKQYFDYKKKHTKVPISVYFSPQAELKATKVELKVAKKIRLPKKDVDFKKSLDGTYIYWKNKNW